MRHFALTSVSGTKYFYKWQQYLNRLDLELQSIADFISWQNPNYNILNYTPGTNGVYYSQQELINQQYIKEVYFYDAEGPAPTSAGGYSANALLVFPSELSFHQGILNNFKVYEKGAYLCFFSLEYLKKFLANSSEIANATQDALWMLPDTLLINGLDTSITRWVPVDYTASWEENLEQDSTNNFATSGEDYAFWRAISDSASDSNPQISPLQNLDPTTFIFNNYRIVSYESTHKLSADSKLIPFKEAFFIISLARVEDNLDSALSPVRLDPNNYLYCRMAGGSPYYSLAGTVFNFQRKGSIRFGNSNILVLANQPVRIGYAFTWPEQTQSLGLLSYTTNPWVVALGNKNGIPWTGSSGINHQISLYTEISENVFVSEEIFTENSSEVGFANIDKNKIPYYTININEGANLKNIEDKNKNSSLEISIW